MLSNLPRQGAVAVDLQLEQSPNTPWLIVLVLKGHNLTVLVRSYSCFIIVSSCWQLLLMKPQQYTSIVCSNQS